MSRSTLWQSSLLVSLVALTSNAAPVWKAADLNPVAFKRPLQHAPVTLVKNGEPLASIVVMKGAAGGQELQKYIAAATGATLPIVKEMPAGPAIVLGDCDEAAALGLVGQDIQLGRLFRNPISGIGRVIPKSAAIQ